MAEQLRLNGDNNEDRTEPSRLPPSVIIFGNPNMSHKEDLVLDLNGCETELCQYNEDEPTDFNDRPNQGPK